MTTNTVFRKEFCKDACTVASSEAACTCTYAYNDALLNKVTLKTTTIYKIFAALNNFINGSRILWGWSIVFLEKCSTIFSIIKKQWRKQLILLASLCFLAVPAHAVTGSLWQGGQRVTGAMFSDPVAGKIGDLITIVVNLSTTSTKDRSTDTSKATTANDSISAFVYPQSGGQWDWYRYRDLAPTWTWSGAHTFKGGGKINDKETFTTTIQARVVDVLPNGSLQIESRRFYEVGKEKSTLVLSGLVRREDISAANSISSTKIADLQIRQEGDGPLSRERRKGWLTKLYEFLSPF